MVTLAQRIEELRTARGLSRPALAAALGFPRTAIEKFETGRQTPTQEQQAKLDSLKSLLDAIRARQMTGSLTGFIDLTAANEIRFGYGQDLTIIVPMNADFQEKTFQLKRVLETMDQRGVERQGTLDLTDGDGEAHLLPQRWLPEGTAEEEQSQAESSQTDESAAPAESAAQSQTDTQGETDEQAQEE